MQGRKEGVLVSEDTKDANSGAFGLRPFNGQIANAARYAIVTMKPSSCQGPAYREFAAASTFLLNSPYFALLIGLPLNAVRNSSSVNNKMSSKVLLILMGRGWKAGYRPGPGAGGQGPVNAFLKAYSIFPTASICWRNPAAHRSSTYPSLRAIST